MLRKIRLVAVAAAIVVIAGCGGSSGTSIKTGDGEVKTDDNGNVQVSTDQGVVNIGAQTNLPDEFPKDVPTPDDLVIQASSTNTQDGKQVFFVNYAAPDAKQAYADYKSKLTGDGFTITNDTTTDAGGQFGGGLEATKDTWKVNVFAAAGDGDGTLSLTVEPTG